MYLSIVVERILYPATLTVLAMWGSAHILGRRIDALATRLGTLETCVSQIDGLVTGLAVQIEALGARQREMARADMLLAECIFRECAKRR